jgi:predicted Zn-dependent protease
MSEERLKTLQRMARERPEDFRLQFGLAVEFLNRGELRAGVAPLRAYLANGQDDGNGWGRLGAALAELGEVVEAMEAYQRGMEIAKGRGHSGLAEEFQEALEALT